MNISNNNTKILRFSSWKSIFPFDSAGIRLHEMCWAESNEFYNFSSQNIDRLLFAYSISGSGILKYDGKEYLIDRGRALIIDMKKPFVLQSNNKKWHFFWLQMSSSLAYDVLPYIIRSGGYAISACSDIVPICDKLFNLSTQAWSSRNELEISSLLYYLLCKMLVTALPDQRLEQVILYIHENYQNSIRVEDLAKIALMSKYHFTRVFKRETGQTPLQYVLGHRMFMAKELLTSSKEPIADVAGAVGYNDASYFSEIFNKSTGYLPKEYRKLFAIDS